MTYENLRGLVDSLADEEVTLLGHALELILRRVDSASVPDAPFWGSRLNARGAPSPASSSPAAQSGLW
jgi:hypothetical protein